MLWLQKLQLLKNDIYSNSFETKLFNNHEKNIANIDLQQTEKKYLAFQYIDARFEHILGNEDYAKKLYDDIIKTNCKYTFCKITEILKIKEE